MRLSPLAESVGARAAPACGLHFEALAALGRGEDVILLTIGDPDLDTPTPIVDAAVAALRGGDTHYTEFAGRPGLRRAIAGLHEAGSGVPTLASQVVVGSGGQNAVFAACLTLFSADDEVLVPEPTYLTYAATVRASGARPIAIPALAGSLRIDLAAMRAATTGRTRGMLLAHPCNPTGAVFGTDEMRELAGMAEELDIWVVSDEVYGCLTYGAAHVPLASVPGMAGRTVTVGSLSKSHAMTGWRMGWAIAPEAVASAMTNLASCMHHGLPGFVQAGALAALERHGECAAAMRATFRARRDIVVDLLHGVAGIDCPTPEAGMFVLADVSGTGVPSGEFAVRLYRETGVAVLDAAAFGPSLAGRVRISLCASEVRLAEGCGRIAAFASCLSGTRRDATNFLMRQNIPG